MLHIQKRVSSNPRTHFNAYWDLDARHQEAESHKIDNCDFVPEILLPLELAKDWLSHIGHHRHAGTRDRFQHVQVGIFLESSGFVKIVHMAWNTSALFEGMSSSMNFQTIRNLFGFAVMVWWYLSCLLHFS